MLISEFFHLNHFILLILVYTRGWWCGSQHRIQDGQRGGGGGAGNMKYKWSPMAAIFFMTSWICSWELVVLCTYLYLKLSNNFSWRLVNTISVPLPGFTNPFINEDATDPGQRYKWVGRVLLILWYVNTIVGKIKYVWTLETNMNDDQKTFLTFTLYLVFSSFFV